MSWVLVDSRGRTCPVQGSAVIGRSSSANIQIDDAQASRQHAEFHAGANRLMMRDLNSRNGTYVNGARIAAPCSLRPGDRLTVGNTTLTVQWVEAPGVPAAVPSLPRPVAAPSPPALYCPACGQPMPAGSIYCQQCGSRMGAAPAAAPAARRAAGWEYKEFVYTFPPKSGWAVVERGGYSEAGAKLEFWQMMQQEIWNELQEWLDEGWEPVGEVGPAGITVRYYRKFHYTAVGWVFIIVFAVWTFGLLLLFLTRTQFAEPVEFRVRMRRARE